MRQVALTGIVLNMFSAGLWFSISVNMLVKGYIYATLFSIAMLVINLAMATISFAGIKRTME
jgi:hypothetical protein